MGTSWVDIVLGRVVKLMSCERDCESVEHFYGNCWNVQYPIAFLRGLLAVLMGFYRITFG